MNRNTESHFAENPINIDIQRSKFNRDSQHKTTINTGDLVPIYVDEVLPGDTFKMDMSAVIRMSTPIFPVMDNCNADFYFFFVPNRLVWEHWREFNGENRTTAWEQPTEYEIPTITAPAETGWTKGTIADYMGIPTQIGNLEVNALPIRAYCLIWNEWFRDENLKDPCMINLDDTTETGTNTGDYVETAQLGAEPLKVAKYHDYFTSALPEPQKGPDVSIPLGTVAPVNTFSSDIQQPTQYTMRWQPVTGSTFPSTGQASWPINMRQTAEGSQLASAFINTTESASATNRQSVAPANLYADLSNATAATINSLRQAFAVQRLYEKDARGGTRYTEMIKAHFGVTSPDARQQRPEYLGGFRQPINIDQVLQTSGTTDVSPQGNTAAYSLTNMAESLFTKSFTEHGYIIGLVAIRTEHTYQQGLERLWNRRQRFDFYYPALANIGEQAILNKEIYAQGSAADEEAFGYQEAWADYRYKPSRVSGGMRSNYATTLDAWHYADDYNAQPTLSSEWIDETTANVDRTLAVQSEIEDQFICDFFFKCTCTRPMPLYSIPGLLDHH